MHLTLRGFNSTKDYDKNRTSFDLSHFHSFWHKSSVIKISTARSHMLCVRMIETIHFFNSRTLFNLDVKHHLLGHSKCKWMTPACSKWIQPIYNATQQCIVFLCRCTEQSSFFVAMRFVIFLIALVLTQFCTKNGLFLFLFRMITLCSDMHS